MRHLCLALALVACASNEDNQRAKARIWGNEQPPTELETRAQQKLAADMLDQDADGRRRALSMDFEEVVARLGFVEHASTARLTIGRGKQVLEVVESATITQGLHGAFRVVQRAGGEEISREAIYVNGVLFVRNGPGKLRVQGIVKDQHKRIRQEAWEPLRTFAEYYGPRFGLKHKGSTSAGGRSAHKYDVVLAAGPDLIQNNAVDRPKRPKSLSGSIVVDAETGVVLQARFAGKLEVPPEKEDAEPGTIALQLVARLEVIEGKEIVVGPYVPTINRHPTDLAPLAFMEGDIKTSTTIGGKKAKTAPEPAEEDEEP